MVSESQAKHLLSQRRLSNTSNMGELDTDSTAQDSQNMGDTEQNLCFSAPEWLNFENYARETLNTYHKELRTLRKQLSDTSVSKTIPFLNACATKIYRWKAKFTVLDSETKNLACTVSVSRQSSARVANDIEDLICDLEIFSEIIEEYLTSAKESIESNSRKVIT